MAEWMGAVSPGEMGLVRLKRGVVYRAKTYGLYSESSEGASRVSSGRCHSKICVLHRPS